MLVIIFVMRVVSLFFFLVAFVFFIRFRDRLGLVGLLILFFIVESLFRLELFFIHFIVVSFLLGAFVEFAFFFFHSSSFHFSWTLAYFC